MMPNPSQNVPGPWPRERLALVYRWSTIALAALLPAVVIASAAAGSSAVSHEWLAGEAKGSSVAAVLHRQGVAAIDFEPEGFCVKPHTRDPAWGCSESRSSPRLAPAEVRRGKVPSCLSVGVPPKGRTAVGFDLPGSAGVIKGMLHADGSKSGIAASLVFDDGEALPNPLETSGKQGRRFRLPVPAGSGRATFEFENEGGKPKRVCIEAVALAGATP